MAESPGSAAHAYAGAENLVAMESAHRYNAFLTRLIMSATAGPGPVLDFGAGRGTLTAKVRDLGVQVEAVEPDPAQRAEITRLGIPAHDSTDDLVGRTFSAVYTCNVLEHIGDDTAALRSLHELLEPGGRLLVYVPALPWLFGDMDRLVGHVRRYRRRELIGKLQAVGFAVERARYADSIGVLATLAFNLLGRGDGTVSTRSITWYDRWAFPVSRALDRVLGRLVGKNLSVVARKPR